MVRPVGADPLVKPPGINTPKLPRGGTTSSIPDDEKGTPKAGLRRLQTMSPSESISTTRVLGPDVSDRSSICASPHVLLEGHMLKRHVHGVVCNHVGGLL